MRPGSYARDLYRLFARIESASELDQGIVREVICLACPRLTASVREAGAISRFIETKAWIDLALEMIGWELPDCRLHRLSSDDSAWACSLGRRGLAMNWAEDVAEFHHESIALALIGALVQAQLNKASGLASSDVIPFARPRTASASS